MVDGPGRRGGEAPCRLAASYASVAPVRKKGGSMSDTQALLDRHLRQALVEELSAWSEMMAAIHETPRVAKAFKRWRDCRARVDEASARLTKSRLTVRTG